MNKKVCIKISGLHKLDTDDDTVEMVTIGSYYKRNGKHYIKYEEMMEGSDETTETIIKISDNEIEVMARGSDGTHLIFTRGQKNMSYYATPFGGISLSVDTVYMNVEESEDSMIVDLKYRLEINSGVINKASVHIEIESVEE